MLRQLAVGGVFSVANIAVHALVMAGVVRVGHAALARWASYPSFLLIGVMIATVSVFMAAHTLEVMIWGLGYALVGAAPEDANPVYFAFVNYTTLGYGDVIPTLDWKLLGPMTAMNGVLLFGWSTAVIFEVLRRTIAQGRTGVPVAGK